MNNSTSRKVNNISLAKIDKSDNGSYNTLLMTLLVVGVVFLILLMFLSKKFRVSRTLNSMDIYIKFQNIQSMKVGLFKRAFSSVQFEKL